MKVPGPNVLDYTELTYKNLRSGLAGHAHGAGVRAPRGHVNATDFKVIWEMLIS